MWNRVMVGAKCLAIHQHGKCKSRVYDTEMEYSVDCLDCDTLLSSNL